MKKIEIHTSCKKMLADLFTPVGIYLRVRDRFRDTILLESTDSQASENSYSFICINAIGGIEINTKKNLEIKWPGLQPQKSTINLEQSANELLNNFMQNFEVVNAPFQEANMAKVVNVGQGLFGYTTYDAISLFDTIPIKNKNTITETIPLMRYRLYQYIIAIHHFKDELYLCENRIHGIESNCALIESLIKSKDAPVYPFQTIGKEISNLTNEAYKNLVEKGIKSTLQGDVFQIVLSRRFQQAFIGDEFNVYRALRSINPSPYLFYFDYGEYKLMGSSPEAQLKIQNGKAIVHPIAGTYKRTGNDAIDKQAAELLQNDEKENAEHVMLVDLARNDLSRVCEEVTVVKYKQVQHFSHVIHLVSEVIGKVKESSNPFTIVSNTFPAGTLSGAPKRKAMELIEDYEPSSRSFYGGAIGCVAFDGSLNQAIMIRSFLSKNNTLTFQAGAGVVAASSPQKKCEEVNHKLGALKKAIELAASIFIK